MGFLVGFLETFSEGVSILGILNAVIILISDFFLELSLHIVWIFYIDINIVSSSDQFGEIKRITAVNIHVLVG